MATDKKSFVLYCDMIHTVDLLEDALAGKLLKHLLRYVNDENPETDDLLLKVAFEPIKRQLKRDLTGWQETRVKRVKSGHEGGIKSGESRRNKKIEANEANALKSKQTKANEAVNVTVTVNDNVIEKYNPNSLSPKMVSIFKVSYPYYPVDEKEDYTSCLQIAYKIAKQKGWQRETVLNGNMSLTLEAWEKIVVFSTTDKWYATRSISDFNKEFQRIVQGMVHVNKKATGQKEETKSTAPPLKPLKHD